MLALTTVNLTEKDGTETIQYEMNKLIYKTNNYCACMHMKEQLAKDWLSSSRQKILSEVRLSEKQKKIEKLHFMIIS